MPKVEFVHTNQASVYLKIFFYFNVNSSTVFQSFFAIFFQGMF